jgi:hypothetical protein
VLFSVAMKKLALILSTLFLISACAAEIGDACDYDVDCSPNMDRNCDRSQPGGYCLIIGCGPDECPSEAVCAEFTTPCPSDYADSDAGLESCDLIEPNRGRTYCMRHCNSESDCDRKKYQCLEVDDLGATVIDFKSKKHKICVPEPDF